MKNNLILSLFILLLGASVHGSENSQESFKTRGLDILTKYGKLVAVRINKYSPKVLPLLTLASTLSIITITDMPIKAQLGFLKGVFALNSGAILGLSLLYQVKK